MIVVWSHSSADSSVADTTYFGIALSRSAIGPVCSRQARARPCQVSRASSSASAASARSSAPCRPASVMYGKSASAGGASMTPSSVACVCAVIEVMHVRPPAAAKLIAAHETGARGRPHARSSDAALEVAGALVRAHPASAMSKERTVLLRTPSFSAEGARPATVAMTRRSSAATEAPDGSRQRRPGHGSAARRAEALGRARRLPQAGVALVDRPAEWRYGRVVSLGVIVEWSEASEPPQSVAVETDEDLLGLLDEVHRGAVQRRLPTAVVVTRGESALSVVLGVDAI